jgi:hypothetical protein
VYDYKFLAVAKNRYSFTLAMAHHYKHKNILYLFLATDEN